MAVERIPITDREQWLQLRKPDLTGSVIGALANCHPYKTIAGLAAEKAGYEFPNNESDLLRRGQVLEDAVAKEVARLRPDWKITKADVYLRDPDARLGATPDFFISDKDGRRGVLQTKVVASLKFKEWRSDDGTLMAPLWILFQVLTESMLADADFGAIAALEIGDFVFRTHIVDVPRHATTEQRIRQMVADFWRDVDAGIVPAIDLSKDADLLAVLYPREREGSIIDLTRDNRAAWLCEERARQGVIIKEAEEAKKTAEVELKSKIGDHEAALIGGWKCTLKTTHRKEIVQPAIEFRVLRTTRIKEEV